MIRYHTQVIIGIKLLALAVVGLQTAWARRKLSASAKAVVGESERQVSSK